MHTSTPGASRGTRGPAPNVTQIRHAEDEKSWMACPDCGGGKEGLGTWHSILTLVPPTFKSLRIGAPDRYWCALYLWEGYSDEKLIKINNMKKKKEKSRVRTAPYLGRLCRTCDSFAFPLPPRERVLGLGLVRGLTPARWLPPPSSPLGLVLLVC